MPSTNREPSASRRISNFFASPSSSSSNLKRLSTPTLPLESNGPSQLSSDSSAGDDRIGRVRAPQNPPSSFSHPRMSRRNSPSSQSAPPVELPGLDTALSSSAGLVWRPPAVDRSKVPQIDLTPNTPASATPVDATGRKLKRRSWMPSSSKHKPDGKSERAPKAWIAGHTGKPPYDLDPLLQGQPVPELWDESGDTLVYLFPRSSVKGPSFKVRSTTFASSTRLVDGAKASLTHTRARRPPELPQLDVSAQVLNLKSLPTPPVSPKERCNRTSDTSSSGSSRHARMPEDPLEGGPPRTIKLYLPITLHSFADGNQPVSDLDTETMLDVRNMFAFLIGQALVATEKRHTIFALFMNVSKVLHAYDFTNLDGSTFGEVTSLSFDSYVEELGIGDIRSSREKTIEALVLGERMRSVSLYNEAFVHAVGKYDEIQYISKMMGPDVKFNLISPITRSRLERASIDLLHREKSIDLRLADFDFPSIFAGVMNSKSVDERKYINFDAWKDSFIATRKYVLSYLKVKYGSWPPKASSKKNDLETSGLNRIVLKSLYYDFADVYDLYVDRASLTTRSMNVSYEGTEEDADPDHPAARILRRVFDEYDRSSPPVQPPVPFDTPLLPGLSHLTGGFQSTTPKPGDFKKLTSKRLTKEEIARVLDTSVNSDTLQSNQSQFLKAMRTFEARQARGCTLNELADRRAGMWIFLYAVIQALPMLVVDAPGVKWHQSVEYFLCEPPRSGVPWVRAGSDSSKGRGWYSVGGSNGVVSLPSDLVEHGVEGVYRRSHCWVVAAKWIAESRSVGSPVGIAVNNKPWDEANMEQERAERVDIYRHESTRLAPPRPRKPSEESARDDSVSSTPRSHSPSSGIESRSRPASRPISQQRPRSQDRRNRRDGALGLGLEALPLPPGVSPTRSIPSAGPRSVSANGPSTLHVSGSAARPPPDPLDREVAKTGGMTFDDILSGMAAETGKKGKKGK